MAGRACPLSQGGDTGSNPVGAASNFQVTRFRFVARFHPVHPYAHRAVESMGGEAQGVADEMGRSDGDVSSVQVDADMLLKLLQGSFPSVVFGLVW